MRNDLAGWVTRKSVTRDSTLVLLDKATHDSSTERQEIVFEWMGKKRPKRKSISTNYHNKKIEWKEWNLSSRRNTKHKPATLLISCIQAKLPKEIQFV